MPWFRRLARLCAASLVAFSCAAPAADPAVSPEPYFKHAEIAAARLSPSGKLLAALAPVGGRRTLVAIVHGERMRDALLQNKTPVEWVAYPEEGHGFMLDANRFDFYGRVAGFLGANLRPD